MSVSGNYKHSSIISARIEWLGKLNDRRLIANADGNIIELEAIAHEYELLKQPCTAMAKEIRLGIAVRKQKVAKGDE